jgi:hypothetical protein
MLTKGGQDMLKKAKLGTIAMVLLVILFFTVATFNAGAVNADKSDKISDKKTSDLKWVTKHVKGVGNVTAREDMFVGKGDNTSIVLNKDYEEIGAITPRFEKVPKLDTVTIDTPYGNVTVSADDYKKLGKDEIIARQKAFIEERNRLIKMGMINTTADSSDLIQVTPQTQTSSLLVPQVMSTAATTSNVDSREDWRFGIYPLAGYPHYLYGRIDPEASSPRPAPGGYDYHELELHLNNPGDVVEFISDHTPTQNNIWVGLYEDNILYWFVTKFDNVNGPIEFYFNYNQGGNRYDIVLYNPATGETRPYYFGSSTISTFIEHMSASVEFGHADPCPPCYTKDEIEQWVVQCGSTYYNPTSIFYPQYGTRDTYVQCSQRSEYGHYITTHEAGNNVPY